MASAVYDDFLSSEQWRQRRDKYIADHASCAACGATRRLHVHHVSYRRLGRELDSDLLTLCHVCHTEVHRLHRQWVEMTLREATLTVLYRQRAA